MRQRKDLDLKLGQEHFTVVFLSEEFAKILDEEGEHVGYIGVNHHGDGFVGELALAFLQGYQGGRTIGRHEGQLRTQAAMRAALGLP